MSKNFLKSGTKRKGLKVSGFLIRSKTKEGKIILKNRRRKHRKTL